MLVFIGFAFTFLFGFLISTLIAKELNLFERSGLSFPLGIGIFTLLMFIFSWAGVPISLIDYSLILLFASVMLLLVQRRTIKRVLVNIAKKIKISKTSFLDKILIFGLVSLAGYSLVTGLYSPVVDWDSLVLYDFRAKVFMNAKYLTDVLHTWSYFWGYPLLTSLGHLWVYLLGGKSPVFIYPLFYISFILVFYGTLRRHSSQTISLVAALLLASNPLIFNQSMIAYTNIPYTFYIVCGTIYIFLWAKESKMAYLILGALLTGLCTWTRSVEPFWLTNIIFVFVYSLYKKRYYSLALYPLVFLSIQFPWRIFQKLLVHIPYVTEQIGTNTSILLKNIDIVRFGTAFSYLYSSVFASWGLSAILFILIVLLNIFYNRWKWSLEFLIIIFANLGLLVLGTYIFSLVNKKWTLIPDSAIRMSMFFVPMFYFYTFSSQILGKFWGGKQNEK